MSYDLTVLQEWAQLRRTYAPRRLSPPDWSTVNRLIVAAEPYLREEATTLRHLLREWSNRFGMQDPLLNDLGSHRWIDKETSYSDWLAWVKVLTRQIDASATPPKSCSLFPVCQRLVAAVRPFGCATGGGRALYRPWPSPASISGARWSGLHEFFGPHGKRER